MLDLFQIVNGRLIPTLVNYENVTRFQDSELEDGPHTTRIYFSTDDSILVNASMDEIRELLHQASVI